MGKVVFKICHSTFDSTDTQINLISAHFVYQKFCHKHCETNLIFISNSFRLWKHFSSNSFRFFTVWLFSRLTCYKHLTTYFRLAFVWRLSLQQLNPSCSLFVKKPDKEVLFLKLFFKEKPERLYTFQTELFWDFPVSLTRIKYVKICFEYYLHDIHISCPKLPRRIEARV